MKGAAWISLCVWVLLVAGSFLTLHALGIHLSELSPQRVRDIVLSFGIWSPVIYLVGYGQPLLPLPASLMIMTSGLAFGPFWGTVVALVGSTIRACGEFALARRFGRQMVSKLFKGTLAKLDRTIAANGFATVLLIRLIPNLPFDLQNYGLGFSQVRFWPFAWATVIGIVPGCFAFVYFGYSLTDLRNIWKLGLAVTIILALMVIQRYFARRVPS